MTSRRIRARGRSRSVRARGTVRRPIGANWPHRLHDQCRDRGHAIGQKRRTTRPREPLIDY